MPTAINVEGFQLQDAPKIYVASLPGKWLLSHATPSWRIDDPEKGFQRMVKEERVREIALAVLDQGRSFPNAVVLATDAKALSIDDGRVILPPKTKFLVIDGQHRIYAQKFSNYEGKYASIIHVGLDEIAMARLFLEINDNQRRVPSSLRWDLVRLVRPEDDAAAIAAAELVFELASNRESPLFQRIDLTGEQGEKDLKQGSIAPELKTLVNSKKGGFKKLDFEQHYETLQKFLVAVKSVDSGGWRSGQTPFLKARVFRALLRLLPDLAVHAGKAPYLIPIAEFKKKLIQIDRDSLSDEAIRAVQGSAGIKEIYQMLLEQTGLGE